MTKIGTDDLGRQRKQLVEQVKRSVPRWNEHVRRVPEERKDKRVSDQLKRDKGGKYNRTVFMGKKMKTKFSWEVKGSWYLQGKMEVFLSRCVSCLYPCIHSSNTDKLIRPPTPSTDILATRENEPLCEQSQLILHLLSSYSEHSA